MKKYELLFVLPGTLSENEVAPAAEKIKAVVEKSGSKNVKMQDLGKSRIAYPIKHIRYGYFQLCQFETEPKNLSEINNTLRLMADLLRFVINVKHGEGVAIDKISAISDVTVRELTGQVKSFEEQKEQRSEEKEKGKEKEKVVEVAEEVAASHQLDKPKAKAKAKSKVKTETKAENINLEDIDKKLDELLDTNIGDV
jgi:small subunit ribosomal protein S6